MPQNPEHCTRRHRGTLLFPLAHQAYCKIWGSKYLEFYQSLKAGIEPIQIALLLNLVCPFAHIMEYALILIDTEPNTAENRHLDIGFEEGSILCI